VKIIVCDFETFYDREFSLSKLTTEEYIRSPLFEVIGVSVKVDDGETQWFSGDKTSTKYFLDQFDWSDCVAVAHNAVFDMAILNWHFDIRPKKIADTLSMARALGNPSVSLAALVKKYEIGEKGDEVINALGIRRVDFGEASLRRYAAYCCHDTELTYSLFSVLADGFPISEMKLIDLTVRMFTEPKLWLDKTRLEDHKANVLIHKCGLLTKASAAIEDLMSNDKLAVALESIGVEPPTKVSARTGKIAWAFSKQDDDFTALLDHEDLRVQTLVAARLGVKSTLEETRTQRFIEIQKRGLLPIPLRFYAAHTGRWGGEDKINMQNLTRKSPLKYAIRAPKGFVLCDSDSSQIEARILAWLSCEDKLVYAFEKGEDVYKIMAGSIYNKKPEDVTKDERFLGKTVVLGCGYGLGHERFRAHMKTQGVILTETVAAAVIGTYRTTFQQIPLLWAEGNKVLEAIMMDRTTTFGRDGALEVHGERGIKLPNGMYLRYLNLRKEYGTNGKSGFFYDSKRGRSTVAKSIWGGGLVENVCQALARIVIGEQMLKVNKKFPVVMTVHDAIACLIPTEEQKTGQEFVELCMKLRPDWALDLPLNCEAGCGPSYGDC